MSGSPPCEQQSDLSVTCASVCVQKIGWSVTCVCVDKMSIRVIFIRVILSPEQTA